jgi:hypothetical protein
MKFQFENTRPEISDSDLLDDLKRVAATAPNGIVTMQEYRRAGKHAAITFQKRFGSWRNAVKAAGFEAGYKSDTVSDEDLLDNLRDCWMKLGRQPRRSEMKPPASKYTHHPYIRRFGTWLDALKTFCDSVDDMGEEAAPIANLVTASRGSREPSLRLRFMVMRRDNSVVCSADVLLPPIQTSFCTLIMFSLGLKEARQLRTTFGRCVQSAT